jgi:predicted 2-oxoglutarate/Fe(II)-dependent dioxygenase YbiX
MCVAATKKAVVIGDGTKEGVVDEEWRKVLCAEVDETTGALIKAKLFAIMPKLEKHFDVTLTGCDGPVFLRYGEGAFYKPHRDASDDSPPGIRKRKVSGIVFLNAQSREALPSCYGGGALTFYGLMEGPQWEKCGFSLDAEPGLFIAFQPETMHEVQPVTFGQRFTVVNWFTTDD